MTEHSTNAVIERHEDCQLERPERPKVKSFEIDDRISIKIKPTLAAEIGDLIFTTNTENKAILAFAHHMQNVLEDVEE